MSYLRSVFSPRTLTALTNKLGHHDKTKLQACLCLSQASTWISIGICHRCCCVQSPSLSRRLPDLIMSNTEKRELLSLREQLDSPSVFLVGSLLTLGNYWVHPPGFWWVNVVYLLSFLCFVLFCLSSSCLVLGVVCVSGLFILDCPFGFL